MARHIKLCLLVVFFLALATAALRPQLVQASSSSTIYLPTVSGATVQTNAVTVRTYYVDCAAGNDAQDGLSGARAWRSLSKANNAGLRPGDSLLFKRGCTWNGPLRAQWTGTADRPVLIGSYGSGALPEIHVTEAAPTGVVISGSYQVIEYLTTRGFATRTDPSCGNQTLGWLVGFEFRGSAAYNTLRHSLATTLAVGINFHDDTHHNRVLNNTLTKNSVMYVLTPVSYRAWDDLGAIGIILKGHSQEVAHNTFEDNNSWCSYDEGFQGNSIEVYGARQSSIHHNRSFNDKVFSELGGGSIKADGVTYAYNLFTTDKPNARFIIARGGGNQYGPTWRTSVLNNTVHMTHPSSQALICHDGCSADILMARNNIIWAEQKTVFADAPFAEGNNIYWASTGSPTQDLRGASMSGTSHMANPSFANSGARDFQLTSASPAVNAGSADSIERGFTVDLAGTAVPQHAAVDIGGYEAATP